MRAYIITTSDNHGRQADLKHYPSMLPKSELFYGVTPADIETPDWWLEANTKHGNNIPERVYCCNKSKELLLRQHRERYPGEDILMMEDDVIFTPDADERYSHFVADVPADWGVQYLGGWHEFSCQQMPIEVKPGVLRCVNVLGSEAVVIRAELVDKTIETLAITPDNNYWICDWQLVKMQRQFYAYAPLGFIAGQQSGWSNLWQKEREMGIRNNFYYLGCDGKIYVMSRS